MSYSPAVLPTVCPECKFVICACYSDEINTGHEYDYNPQSTEPSTDIEERKLNLSNDNFDCFEFNDMANNWR